MAEEGLCFEGEVVVNVALDGAVVNLVVGGFDGVEVGV